MKELKFVTLSKLKVYGQTEDTVAITINTNHVINFYADGERTRLQLTGGADRELLVEENYAMVYQQITGKVFLG